MGQRFSKLKEQISILQARKPAGLILSGIILANIVFFIFSACVISFFAPETMAHKGFWVSLYYTVTMVLDAGCIEYVITDVGEVGVFIIVTCIVIIFLGMVIFTGAMIGFITNWISTFIDKANQGAHSLHISDHTVILNWNSRASEIVNDLLYTGKIEKIVVLVPENKDKVEKEIHDRITDTVSKEKAKLQEICKNMSFFKKELYKYNHRIHAENLKIIVREGDTYFTQELNDICIKQAKSVVILGKDDFNNVCKYEMMENLNQAGNSNTIKTLVQVADLTSADDSANDQKIIVEVEDDWTLGLVETIISHKEKHGKCNIVPVSVNRILGQILSQFSIMPELNLVYSELFSNKDAAFYDESMESKLIVDSGKYESEEFYKDYMKLHKRAIPLTSLDTRKTGKHFFYIADKAEDINNVAESGTFEPAAVQPDFQLEKRNVIILGHNSKNSDIMKGFNSFCEEWHIPGQGAGSILDITVIDEADSLEKLNYYSEYDYVTNCVTADVYDRELITEIIKDFIDCHVGDVSILILSDDHVKTEDLDAKALSYLIYVQDIIHEKIATNPDFDPESIDVVVELLNPKNSDVVKNYSVDNVVISNRYISKMVTQIGEKESLFDFYTDILTYDADEAETYNSKELYAKKVHRFFEKGKIPEECTATELIRSVYDGSKIAAKKSTNPAYRDNFSVVIGYVKKGKVENEDEKMVIFSGNQDKIKVRLEPEDKLIIFSKH